MLVKHLEVTTMLNETSANPIEQFSRLNQIPFHFWPNSDQNVRGFHLAVVCSFGKLIPNDVIKCFSLY